MKIKKKKNSLNVRKRNIFLIQKLIRGLVKKKMYIVIKSEYKQIIPWGTSSCLGLYVYTYLLHKYINLYIFSKYRFFIKFNTVIFLFSNIHRTKFRIYKSITLNSQFKSLLHVKLLYCYVYMYIFVNGLYVTSRETSRQSM